MLDTPASDGELGNYGLAPYDDETQVILRLPPRLQAAMDDPSVDFSASIYWQDEHFGILQCPLGNFNCCLMTLPTTCEAMATSDGARFVKTAEVQYVVLVEDEGAVSRASCRAKEADGRADAWELQDGLTPPTECIRRRRFTELPVKPAYAETIDIAAAKNALLKLELYGPPPETKSKATGRGRGKATKGKAAEKKDADKKPAAKRSNRKRAGVVDDRPEAVQARERTLAAEVAAAERDFDALRAQLTSARELNKVHQVDGLARQLEAQTQVLEDKRRQLKAIQEHS
jgi:hypothetical protein